MDLIHPQLAAFAAVLEEGSFEAAARRLSITPSAVSQPIKALEDRLGQVLVVRQTPCRPTPAGERLLRRVRPMQALQAEALADFLPEKNGTTLARSVALAVNDDSLATWFLSALSTLHQQHASCSICTWMTRITPSSSFAPALFWGQLRRKRRRCKAVKFTRSARCATVP